MDKNTKALCGFLDSSHSAYHAAANTAAALDEAGTLGLSFITLEVRASNVAALALYESLGFNEATIRRNYYPTADGREDAIVMALPISM